MSEQTETRRSDTAEIVVEELAQAWQSPPAGRDPLLEDLWQRHGQEGDPPAEGVFPSQQAEPGQPLTAPEQRVAMLHWRLTQQGAGKPKARGYSAALHEAEAAFDRHASEYGAAVHRLTRDERTLRWADVEATVEAITTGSYGGYGADPRPVFDLDDLASDATTQIIADHLRAAAVVWSHARLDEAGVFVAVDAVIAAADDGQIPLDGRSAKRLEHYRRRLQNRWPTEERVAALRERVLGPPLPMLFAELVRAGHDYARRLTPVDLVGSAIPSSISEEPVRAAAADVAAHFTEAGWGSTYATAAELEEQIQLARELLTDECIVSGYCSRDWLGVVARAAGTDRVEVTRDFAIAEAGVIVIAFLADNAEVLSDDDLSVSLGLPGGSGGVPDPSDPGARFLAACERLHRLTRMPDADEECEEAEEESSGHAEPVFQPAGHGPGTVGAFRLKPSMFPNGSGSM